MFSLSHDAQVAALMLLASLGAPQLAAVAAAAALGVTPVSFEGSAFLFPYYSGVVEVFLERGVILPGETQLSGLSGGAFTATLTSVHPMLLLHASACGPARPCHYIPIMSPATTATAAAQAARAVSVTAPAARSTCQSGRHQPAIKSNWAAALQVGLNGTQQKEWWEEGLVNCATRWPGEGCSGKGWSVFQASRPL